MAYPQATERLVQAMLDQCILAELDYPTTYAYFQDKIKTTIASHANLAAQITKYQSEFAKIDATEGAWQFSPYDIQCIKGTLTLLNGFLYNISEGDVIDEDEFKKDLFDKTGLEYKSIYGAASGYTSGKYTVITRPLYDQVSQFTTPKVMYRYDSTNKKYISLGTISTADEFSEKKSLYGTIYTKYTDPYPEMDEFVFQVEPRSYTFESVDTYNNAVVKSGMDEFVSDDEHEQLYSEVNGTWYKAVGRKYTPPHIGMGPGPDPYYILTFGSIRTAVVFSKKTADREVEWYEQIDRSKIKAYHDCYFYKSGSTYKNVYINTSKAPGAVGSFEWAWDTYGPLYEYRKRYEFDDVLIIGARSPVGTLGGTGPSSMELLFSSPDFYEQATYDASTTRYYYYDDQLANDMEESEPFYDNGRRYYYWDAAQAKYIKLDIGSEEQFLYYKGLYGVLYVSGTLGYMIPRVYDPDLAAYVDVVMDTAEKFAFYQAKYGKLYRQKDKAYMHLYDPYYDWYEEFKKQQNINNALYCKKFWKGRFGSRRNDAWMTSLEAHRVLDTMVDYDWKTIAPGLAESFVKLVRKFGHISYGNITQERLFDYIREGVKADYKLLFQLGNIWAIRHELIRVYYTQLRHILEEGTHHRILLPGE